jgi:predicted RNA binding protein YcfA (HicA-like mRNA interferase family)
MRIPRDITGKKLIKKLSVFGYKITKQTGSHVKITTIQKGEHHCTIPLHNPLKVGTLNAVMKDISKHIEIPKSELIKELF